MIGPIFSSNQFVRSSTVSMWTGLPLQAFTAKIISIIVVTATKIDRPTEAKSAMRPAPPSIAVMTRIAMCAARPCAA